MAVRLFRSEPTAPPTPTVDPGQARWVISVLNLCIAAVGQDSVLGILLRQNRREILSLLDDGLPIRDSSAA